MFFRFQSLIWSSKLFHFSTHSHNQYMHCHCVNFDHFWITYYISGVMVGNMESYLLEFTSLFYKQLLDLFQPHSHLRSSNFCTIHISNESMPVTSVVTSNLYSIFLLTLWYYLLLPFENLSRFLNVIFEVDETWSKYLSST